MLGQAHHPLARLLGIAGAVFVVVVLPAAGKPDPARTAGALRVENAQLAAQSRSAVLGLYSLDSQLAAARSHLASVQAQLELLRNERATLRRELEIARLGKQSSERRLASRLRQLYDQGEVSAIEVVFGAESITDALTQFDNLHRVASLNEEVLAQLQIAQTRLSATSRRLGARTSELTAALHAASAAESSLATTRAARAAYVASLDARQNLNSTQIAHLESQARGAQAKSRQLTVTAASGPLATPVVSMSRTPAPAPGAHTLTASITGYALPGTTATGIPVGWGVAAVDPRVIPLGTHFSVPGYGEAVAADIGGAIVGNRVDIWFPTVALAHTWGWRTVTITIH